LDIPAYKLGLILEIEKSDVSIGLRT